jgi:3-dehydroquinate dehydratase/shikimate dehydrogenase
MPAPTLSTNRLLLRQWKSSDLPLFAKMNADQHVMKYFPSLLTKKESNYLAEKIQQELQEKEYGFWAIEVPNISSFIGLVGLHYPDFKAHFTPCVEIGWRLAYEYWGKGYAFEAATKIIEYAFNELKLNEIVSFTTIDNIPSRNLMEKLEMTHNPQDDFKPPKIPKNHSTSSHVLYRLNNSNI